MQDTQDAVKRLQTHHVPVQIAAQDKQCHVDLSLQLACIVNRVHRPGSTHTKLKWHDRVALSPSPGIHMHQTHCLPVVVGDGTTICKKQGADLKTNHTQEAHKHGGGVDHLHKVPKLNE